jgi:integrase
VRARGAVFRPTYRAAAGRLRRQAVWWLDYYQDGRRVRRSSGTKVKAEAEKSLREALGEVDAGTAPPPGEVPTVAALHQLVADDYARNGRKSVRDVDRGFGYLERFFGDRPASSIKVADVDGYIAARLAGRVRGPEKKGRYGRRARRASRATINRELAHLRRGFRLAVRKGRLSRRPDFSLLAEHNRRTGFFEVEEFEAILSKLPAHLIPLMQFLYWTGWRSSEARGLEWRQVDRAAGVIRIEETKNREPRTIPYGVLSELREIIEGQRARADDLQRSLRRVVKHVFFTDSGLKIHDYAGAWDAARKAAGLPGRLVHDFRRTAARNMLRHGIPQQVAMQLGGWKTVSVFGRYSIVDERLLAENLKKLGARD